MTATRTEVIVPSALTPPDHAALIDALYTVHCDIFAGVDRPAFQRYVVDSPATWTRIMVQRDARDAIVGYFAAHAFHRPVHGEDAVVLRGEAGFLRSHRGHNSTVGFGLREALKTVLCEAGRPVYYLGCLVHPVSYYALAKRMRPVWPSPQTPVEGRLLDELCALGDAFGLEPVGDDPLVRHVGWRTLESPAERDWWARCDKPAVRYYVQRNLGYGAGHGLLTLARVSPATLAGAAVSVAREQVTRCTWWPRARCRCCARGRPSSRWTRARCSVRSVPSPAPPATRPCARSAAPG